jgi:glycerol-3-phosphate cytidylyltransferase
MIKGFTCGAFDLLHAGHILMLEQCKKMCDYLTVGIQSDPSIDRPEKHKPVQSLLERQIQVKACRYVDEVVTYNTEKDLEELLYNLPIQKRFIGEDHIGGFMTGEEICKKRGIEIVFTKRDHDYSSSNLRERIKCS